MSDDLFGEVPPLPLRRSPPARRPVDPDKAAARIIAAACFPASYSENERVAAVPAGDMGIAKNRELLEAIALRAVVKLRERGLLR